MPRRRNNPPQTQHPAASRQPNSFNNHAFLNSPDARNIRVLCEMTEPASRFRRYNVRNTIVFFGSTRTLPRDVAMRSLQQLQKKIRRVRGPVPQGLQAACDLAQRDVVMSRYYQDAMQLAERLTRWSMGLASHKWQFTICSGGGAGIMEAANRGAAKASGKSVGLNISLLSEQMPNRYQSPELSFEFHYFFIRKFWFFYLARALVIFPGGFGTMDELFELLTLVQTRKTKKYMPIVVYGSEYWREVVNFEALAKWGTISPEDLKLFRLFDDVDSAFDFLTSELIRECMLEQGEV
jgi:uncharacterized protein (TIGR00730 family)